MVIPNKNLNALNGEIQMKYLQLFRRGDIVLAENFKKNSGIEPIIDDDAKTAIQEGYSLQFRYLLNRPQRDYEDLLHDIRDFEKFTGIAPENTQKVYDELTKLGQNDSYWLKVSKSMKDILEK
jgi:hypothetical protein